MTESQNDDKDNLTRPIDEETAHSDDKKSLTSPSELETQVSSRQPSITNAQAYSGSDITNYINNPDYREEIVKNISNAKCTSIMDYIETISDGYLDSSGNQHDINQNMRYQLNFVWKQNKDYVINDITLGYTLIKHIDDNDKSIVFNDFPGSGKTSFCGLLEEIGKEIPSKFVSEVIEQDKELKDKISNLMGTILIFKVDCKELLISAIHSVKSSQNKSIEDYFIHRLIVLTIDILKTKTELPKYEGDKLDNFHTQSLEQLTSNKEECSSQSSIHIKLMTLIMNMIDDGTLKKSQVISNSEDEKKKPKISRNKVERLIIIIDEANIFESQQIASKFLGRHKEYLNFFVTLFDGAIRSDPDGIKGRTVNFIFSSVVPIYTEKISNRNFWMIDSFNQVLKQTKFVSFGELQIDKFREMTMSSGPNNKTRRLYDLYTKCKTTKFAIEDYLATDMSPDLMAVLKEQWERYFPDKLYTNGSIPNDYDIPQHLFFFFMSIFGQPLYIFKNSLTVATRTLKRNEEIIRGCLDITEKDKDEDGTVKCYIPNTKLNCDMMMNLIVNDGVNNRINGKCGKFSSEEIHMKEFFKCFAEFKEKYSVDGFPHLVTIKTLKLLNQRRDIVPHDSYHQTLYLACHLSLVKLRLWPSKVSDGDEIKEYYFTWMTRIVKMWVMKQYEEYKQRVSTIYDYENEDKDKLLLAIEDFTFFKSKVMPEVNRRTEIQFMHVEKNLCNEGDVRDVMEDKLKEVIREKVKSICNYHDEEGLDDFINVKPECHMNKRYPEAQTRKTAKLDLNVILRTGNDPGSRLRVIFELKKDVGTIYNHSIMKEVKKNYNTLDFLDNESNLIYVSASMNWPGVAGNTNKYPTISYYMSKDINSESTINTRDQIETNEDASNNNETQTNYDNQQQEVEQGEVKTEEQLIDEDDEGDDMASDPDYTTEKRSTSLNKTNKDSSKKDDGMMRTATRSSTKK